MRQLIASLLIFIAPFSCIQAATQIEMQTNLGAMVLELDEQKAPETVENFLRYVDSKFYDGTVFHRVINGFMIQGGGYDQQYQRKATRKPIPNEADNGLKNLRGTIAMARTSDPHSATAQFFINQVDNPNLDYRGRSRADWGYCVFGKVISGLDVLDRIANQPTTVQSPMLRNAPKQPVIIERISRSH